MFFLIPLHFLRRREVERMEPKVLLYFVCEFSISGGDKQKMLDPLNIHLNSVKLGGLERILLE